MAEQDEHTVDGPDPPADLAWATDAATPGSAARFFARTIGSDARYISHGEIQGGLSPDGVHWATDLETQFVANLRDVTNDHGLLVAQNGGGAIVGAAVVEWSSTPRVRFGVLADLAVDPAMRSTGLGARMVEEIVREARRRGMQWLFLESGKHNAAAHRFFERHGFAPVSTVFARRL